MLRTGRPVTALHKHFGDFRGGPRFAKQVTLHFYAADPQQRLVLLLGLDSFRRRNNVQIFGKASDRIDDGGRFCAVRQILNE
jgi:hypothetical protein